MLLISNKIKNLKNMFKVFFFIKILININKTFINCIIIISLSHHCSSVSDLSGHRACAWGHIARSVW